MDNRLKFILSGREASNEALYEIAAAFFFGKTEI